MNPKLKMINRKEAPAFRSVESVELIRPEIYTLTNGLKAYVISAGEQDLVRIEFIFRNTFWDPASPLSPGAVNGMLAEGTRKMTSGDIASFVDYYGAFLQTDFSYDHSSLILFTLNKHVNTLLPVIADVVFAAVFPESELATYRKNHRQKLQVSLHKNDIVARRELNNLLFGDSIYGYRPIADDYDTLERESLLACFHQCFTPANLTLVVSGKVSDEVMTTIDRYIGSTGTHGQKGELPMVSMPQRIAGMHFFERPEALQSAIRMGKRAVNRTHVDFPALQVLMTIFGGYFGSRLMANIREDKGFTYGIGAGLASMQQAGYFYLATEVGTDVCKQAIDEIKKEMQILQSEPVPAEELDLVKNYIMGSFLGDLENAFSHADKFKSIHFYGLGYEYYDRFVETVLNITPDRLQALANQYLDFDSFERVIVGKF